MPKAYRDIKIGRDRWFRHFNNFTQEDYVWHRDKKDRYVSLEYGNGYKLQFEDELPFLLEKDTEYFIPKEIYHRIVGCGKLIIKIREMII